MRSTILKLVLALAIVASTASSAWAIGPPVNKRCIIAMDIGFNAMMNKSKTAGFFNADFRYAPSLHFQLARFGCTVWKNLQITGGFGLNVVTEYNVGSPSDPIVFIKLDAGAAYYFNVLQKGIHSLYVVPGLRLGLWFADSVAKMDTQVGIGITILARLSYVLKDVYEFRFTPLMFELLPAFTKGIKDFWKGGGVYNYSFLFGFGYRFSL